MNPGQNCQTFIVTTLDTNGRAGVLVGQISSLERDGETYSWQESLHRRYFVGSRDGRGDRIESELVVSTPVERHGCPPTVRTSLPLNKLNQMIMSIPIETSGYWHWKVVEVIDKFAVLGGTAEQVDPTRSINRKSPSFSSPIYNLFFLPDTSNNDPNNSEKYPLCKWGGSRRDMESRKFK
ncbi:hypothetical protein BJ165DRAFT_1484063 [Panaeolus papilionaceus]|nr:hypothetical protein BJ165DRAFT_1484063 [Panaeolus papilionaceus]